MSPVIVNESPNNSKADNKAEKRKKKKKIRPTQKKLVLKRQGSGKAQKSARKLRKRDRRQPLKQKPLEKRRKKSPATVPKKPQDDNGCMTDFLTSQLSPRRVAKPLNMCCGSLTCERYNPKKIGPVTFRP